VAVEDEFTEFAIARAGRLREIAFLMCGDWHQAQDLTQQTLTKVYVSWRRIRSRDNVDAYARRVLLRELLNERRLRRSSERPVADVPEAPAVSSDPDLRLTLLQALATIPAKRRAVIILRYWDDHSVERVAEIMQLSTSAVKSLTVRGLADVRAALDAEVPITHV
jgi:RNA polymerase sigma-70 factor (sigma-E family)